MSRLYSNVVSGKTDDSSDKSKSHCSKLGKDNMDKLMDMMHQLMQDEKVLLQANRTSSEQLVTAMHYV